MFSLTTSNFLKCLFAVSIGLILITGASFSALAQDVDPPLLIALGTVAGADGYINAAESTAADLSYTFTDASGVYEVFIEVFDDFGECIPVTQIDDGTGSDPYSGVFVGSVAGCADGTIYFFIGAFDFDFNFEWYGPFASIKDTVAPNATSVTFNVASDGWINAVESLFIEAIIEFSDAGTGIQDGYLAMDTGGSDCLPVVFMGNGGGAASATLGSGANIDTCTEGIGFLFFGAVDTAGNFEWSFASGFSLDFTPPVTSPGAGPASPTNDANPSFSFTADDAGGSGVSSSECTLTGPAGAGPASCSSGVALSDLLGGSLMADGSEDGDYQLAINSTDIAGNVESTAYFNWTYDSQAPELTVPGDINIDATSIAGAVVNYVASATDAVDPAPDVNCSQASGTTFAVGQTTVTCTATDEAGNTSEQASFDVFVTLNDIFPPSIGLQITSGPSYEGLPGACAGIGGASCYVTSATQFGIDISDAETSVAGCTITVAGPLGSSNPACAAGTTTLSLSGPDGLYLITAEATDALSNMAVGTLTVVLDNTAPVISISAPLNNQEMKVGSTVLANYGASDAGSGVASLVGSVAIGLPINTSTLGLQNFVVNAADQLGNASEATNLYRVTHLSEAERATVFAAIRLSIQQQIAAAIAHPDFDLGEAITLCFELKDPATDLTLANLGIRADLSRVVNPVTNTLAYVRFLGDLAYDADEKEYCLTFNTVDADGNPLAAGLYEILLVLDDGTLFSVRFELK